METHDVIVIGAGHNVLVSAAYLAKAGKSVLVQDKNDRPGGFVRTDEIMPGFFGDAYSAAHTLFVPSPVYADLGEDLKDRGLRYLNTELPSGVSMEDGTTAVFPGRPRPSCRRPIGSPRATVARSRRCSTKSVRMRPTSFPSLRKT